MKQNKQLGHCLSRKQQGAVKGGLYAPPICMAKASCGTNGSVSCVGYQTSSGAGCAGTDGVGVSCADSTGTVKLYGCSIH